MRVLVLNSGSSSQKSALYEIGEALPEHPPPPVWRAEIDWSTQPSTLRIATQDGLAHHEPVSFAGREPAVTHMLNTIWSGALAVLNSRDDIDVVGHRIVHGGPRLDRAVLVDEQVKRTIASVAAFAPLHNRAELKGIEIIERLMGMVPQVAVFDTGFHRTLPLAAAVYPGPYEWFEHDIRRYGFHGINYQYCAERVAHLLDRDLRSLKIVCCHLGNGCSVAAIDGGRSVDTTMGFTPLEGLMMGTRSGSIDPGILTYLMREQHISGEALDQLLNQQSGLLGISGISADMRQLLAAIGQGNQRAKLAFDMFVHRLAKAIAAMAASMSGIDVLVFTGGIGEHSPQVRSASCERLRFLGLDIDPEFNNSAGDRKISSARSPLPIVVVKAQEDWTIAKICVQMLRNAEYANTKVSSDAAPTGSKH